MSSTNGVEQATGNPPQPSVNRPRRSWQATVRQAIFAALKGYTNALTLDLNQIKARITALETEHARLTKDLTDRPLLRAGFVWQPGITYDAGTMATFDGSLWTCITRHESTGHFDHACWRLSVKRGRDGRDARS